MKFELTSQQMMKLSLVVFHVLLFILVQKDTDVAARMFDMDCWAIVLNLGALSGNKYLQSVIDRAPVGFRSTTIKTETKDVAKPGKS